MIIAEPGGDRIEARLRCGPCAARHTIIAGAHLVNNGVLTAPGSEDVLTRHREASARIQNRSWTIGHRATMSHWYRDLTCVVMG